MEHDPSFIVDLFGPETPGLSGGIDRVGEGVGDAGRVAGVPGRPFIVLLVDGLPFSGRPAGIGAVI